MDITLTESDLIVLTAPASADPEVGRLAEYSIIVDLNVDDDTYSVVWRMDSTDSVYHIAWRGSWKSCVKWFMEVVEDNLLERKLIPTPGQEVD